MISLDTGFCGGCGYRLKGLADGGRCPECGKTFSPDELILWGGKGALAGVPPPALRPMVLLMFVLCVAANSVAFFLADVSRRTFFASFTLIFAILLVVAWWSYGKKWQICLSRRGYGVGRGPGTIRIRPWGSQNWIYLSRVTPSIYQLRIVGSGLSAVSWFECPEVEIEDLRARMAEVIGRPVEWSP